MGMERQASRNRRDGNGQAKVASGQLSATD